MTTEQRTYLYQGLPQWQLAEELDWWCSEVPSSPAYAEAGTLEWKFEPEFNLERLADTVRGNNKNTWVQWLAQECANRAYDLGEDPDDTSYHSLERWWLEPQNRYDEPLVIGYGADGKPLRRMKVSATNTWTRPP
jgi:hypothetical protein